MKARYFKSALNVMLAIIFWLAIWEITAITVDLQFIFPRITSTLKALGTLFVTGLFWKSILYSLLRVVYGFLLGAVIGFLLALLCNRFSFISAIISPAITAVKSTPVASIIMLLWFIIGSKSVPIAIAVLMVAPIVWQSTVDGYKSIDRELIEVCMVFKISYMKKLKILIIPSMLKTLLPSLISASALAWKSGIAAEIITYTENSIGRIIIDSKGNFDGASMFAMTLVVIVLSVIIEKLIKKSIKAVIKRWN